MSYREMAMDAGARGEDEIRQMAAAIEEDWHRAAYEAAMAEAGEVLAVTEDDPGPPSDPEEIGEDD